ncbi:hypothetical protein AHAS_Ahas12G0149300 [Arachis hypogaea]
MAPIYTHIPSSGRRVRCYVGRYGSNPRYSDKWSSLTGTTMTSQEAMEAECLHQPVAPGTNDCRESYIKMTWIRNVKEGLILNDPISMESWGSASLAHLYRALCRATRFDCKEIDDPLTLLHIWTWILPSAFSRDSSVCILSWQFSRGSSVCFLSWQFRLRFLVAVPSVFPCGSSVCVSFRQFRLRFLQTSGSSVCTSFRQAAVLSALPSD